MAEPEKTELSQEDKRIRNWIYIIRNLILLAVAATVGCGLTVFLNRKGLGVPAFLMMAVTALVIAFSVSNLVKTIAAMIVERIMRRVEVPEKPKDSEKANK